MPFPASFYPHVTWNRPHLKPIPSGADATAASGVWMHVFALFEAIYLNFLPQRRRGTAGMRGSNMDAIVRPQIKPPPHV